MTYIEILTVVILNDIIFLASTMSLSILFNEYLVFSQSEKNTLKINA